MSSQSTFQAKLLTAAGDQITKTIKTLDKDDIKVAFTTISGKFRSKEAKKDDVPTDLVKKEVKVSGHEDNAALVAQEFDIFNLKDRRGESGNYKSFEYIDYDKDAKVFGPENQEVDKDLELGESSKLISSETKNSGNFEILESIENLESLDNLQDKEKDGKKKSNGKNEGSQSQDIASFVQKKNAAQGMMDLALVSANTNQLRYVMDMSHLHPYYYTSMALIITSLAMQVCVGLGLFYTNGYNLRRKADMKSATRWNDVSTVGVFLITLINVFISTFNGTSLGKPDDVSNSTTVAPNAC